MKARELIIKSDGTVRIPLGRSSGHGKCAIIDIEDVPRVAGFNWAIRGNGYAGRSVGSATEYLHRVICPPRFGEEPDHINRNRLDNRRENLRSVSRSINRLNTLARGISKHKGAYRQPNSAKSPWSARIGTNGKVRYLGCFKTVAAAHAAWLAAAKMQYGDDAALGIEPTE